MTQAPAPCPGCGVTVAGPEHGRTHPYMVASPGCWASFGEMQAAEYGNFGYPAVHGIAVDAYAASHGGPGVERRDRQSVAIHVLALRAVLERGESSQRRIEMLRRLTEQKRDWPLLDRPNGLPALTHLHAAGVSDHAEYEARVREWATSVWQFWGPRHGVVAELAGELDPA